eukprot:TRINITY_DN13290_c0_g1_i3.p2 TRINITY_DN13290_c0_g1~~TRINITY_DN13290_c0_g1_i3.p2  ORF type:complete len:176 (-),score=35.48 TRINITY_DN13290_c0_g1_i3:259-786(-)
MCIRDSSTDWLDTYLRPAFKAAFSHLALMAKRRLFKDHRVFQLYGVDFILDKDLNLWLLEVNGIPAMEATNDQKTRFLTTLLRDQMEVIFAQIRSRSTRVQQFIGGLTEELLKQGDSMELSEIDLGNKREEFAKLVGNRIDEPFKISENNTFSKVLDENFQGKDAYLAIDESCWK